MGAVKFCEKGASEGESTRAPHRTADQRTGATAQPERRQSKCRVSYYRNVVLEYACALGMCLDFACTRATALAPLGASLGASL